MLDFFKFVCKYFSCRHIKLRFLRNLYGAEVKKAGGKKSVWICEKCGIPVLKDVLHYTD